MAKKKNKQIIRPWCWYCEREFEDEKVLMQHQKAKHFKCNMCPRRLNTAGGLAVHIQQVHKLEPENLPRIENALPGRDGYEVEIFGMEGIPAPDVADYKRRKEIELGLSAGSISQPPAKRAKVENRPISEEELKAQLEAHKALMGNNAGPEGTSSGSGSQSVVYGAPAQTYAVPPMPVPPQMPPSNFFGGPPPGFPGQPFPPPFAGFPPGPPPPGFPGFPGAPPFPPMPPAPGAVRPPFMPPPPGTFPPGFSQSPPGPVPPPQFVPAQQQQAPPSVPSPQAQQQQQSQGQSQSRSDQTRPEPQAPVRPPQLTLPNEALAQTNPEFKKATSLKYSDPNFSADEQRAIHLKYFVPKSADVVLSQGEESRGKKRARAEDFL